MSSLLSRAFSRRSSFPRLSCIALLVAGIGLASCGGDDDDPPPAPKQADQVGALHGALAAALQEELGIGAPLTNLATPVDALQDIVILSDPNGIRDDHPALPLMKNAFYSGRAVVLENVNAKEVNTLIKALGVRISAFSPPKGAEFVELFAVRKVKNNTWFFVDLGASWEPIAGDDFQNNWNLFSLDKTASYDSCGLPGDEQTLREIHVCGNDESESSSPADGAEGVRQQAQQCEAATQALGAPRALSPTLAKAIRASTEPVEETGVDPDCNGRNPNSVCGPMRSRALLDWAQRGREEAAKPPQSVVLQNAGDTTPKYEPAAEMNWEFSQTPGGRQFRLVFEMTAYHSFDEHVDYYFISQSGDFSVKDAWRNEPGCVDPKDLYAYQYGYVRFYEFEHALHDYAGGPYDYGFGSHEPVNITYSPVNQNSEYSVSIGTEKGLSGSVGFSAGYSKASSASDADPLAGGPQASASASLGVSIQRSTSALCSAIT
ncbi:MAG: hypothetical protein J6T92_04195 [Ottowia sp.]|nr:hypothetical protein [Ottowia sp.]